MSDNKIRFVVIGFGHIGRRHADMVMNHDGCELVAVVDTNPELKESVRTICDVPYFLNHLISLFFRNTFYP